MRNDVIKLFDNYEDSFKLFLKTRKSFAVVTDRQLLEFTIENFGKSKFYLPPETPDASFFVGQRAVAIKKHSKWKTILNPM